MVIRPTRSPAHIAAALAALVVGLVGCEKQHLSALEAVSPASDAALADRAGPTSPVAGPSARDRTLAYEHSVTVELNSPALPARVSALRTACDSRRDLACTILDIREGSQFNLPSAHIRMRMAPAGVDAFIEVASRGAKVISRDTHAEDLAEPIADADRTLAQLASHRDRMNEFLARRNLTVDQEISLSKEVSSVQSQIDDLNTQKANLRRRVDTELLSIELVSPEVEFREQRHPIADALQSFGTDFRDAIAQVIRFLAVLLPWLVIGIPGVIGVRVLWRAISRWLTARETERRG